MKLLISLLSRVCVRSPLIPARSAITADSGNGTARSEIWTNPHDEPIHQRPTEMEGRISENKDKRSDEDQRIIDQQRIAKNIMLMASSFPKKPDEIKKEGYQTEQRKMLQNDTPTTPQPDYMPDMLV